MIAETPTDVGSYFIANYPPFSLWEPSHVPEIRRALTSEPDRSVTMGLYIHIPFCRKRCKFCYFRVYTNQNAQAIENYVQALEHEFELLSQQPGVQGARCGLPTSAAARPPTSAPSNSARCTTA